MRYLAGAILAASLMIGLSLPEPSMPVNTYDYCTYERAGLVCGTSITPPRGDRFPPEHAGIVVNADDGSGTGPTVTLPAGTFTGGR